MKKIGFLLTFIFFILCLASCSSNTKTHTIICYSSPKISDSTFEEMNLMSSNVIYANITSVEANFESISFYLDNIEYIKGEDVKISKVTTNYNRYLTASEYRNGDMFGVDFQYTYLIDNKFKVYFYLDDSTGSLTLIKHRNAICVSNDDADIYMDKYIIEE